MKNDTIPDNQQEENAAGEKKSCPVQATIGVLSGKWKLLLLFQLRNGEKRFGELGRALPGITPATLTSQLRELEEDGIVQRKAYAEIPPRVEYTLTEIGQSLLPVIINMEKWGLEYFKQMKGAAGDCLWDDQIIG
ncbi:helix-turn-helix domain-containing protein [Chitinophaga sp. GbtcB8]|uniref:winged helix-turn-helix transcriptional regulator n=1 Tax=Chitinophaga sp. GbtcB8 TaxID=2824753 RepID=UPI001C306CC6|nr:helix-turn-helix domain-containing protein [Chitinophaga sp. GbtcB8]